MADFTAQDLANTNNAVAPVAYNGNMGQVQTSTSATFIDPSNFIVLDKDSSAFSLRDTLAYRLNFAIGSPETPRLITHADLNDSVIAIQRTFEMYSLIMYLHGSNGDIAWTFSACDVVSSNAWEAVANRDNALAAADALYGGFLDSNVFASRVCPNIQLAAALAVVNAIHRATVAGHTWLSANVGNRSTPTYKAIAAAGELKDALIAYAGPNNTGHDMFHIFTRDCLAAIADILTDGTVIAAGEIIGGNDIGPEDIALMDLFAVPQGCIDRWPVGMAGKGAIFLGIAEIERVLSAITVVVRDIPMSGVEASFTSLRKSLSDESLERADLLQIKSFVGNMSGFAWGFSSATRDGAERLQGMVSLRKLVDKHSSQCPTGLKLGEYFNDLELNKDAAVSIAREFITSISFMLGNVLGIVTGATLAGHKELAISAATVAAADLEDIDMAVPEIERKTTAKRRNTNLDTIVKMKEIQVTLADIDELDK